MAENQSQAGSKPSILLAVLWFAAGFYLLVLVLICAIDNVTKGPQHLKPSEFDWYGFGVEMAIGFVLTILAELAFVPALLRIHRFSPLSRTSLILGSVSSGILSGIAMPFILLLSGSPMGIIWFLLSVFVLSFLALGAQALFVPAPTGSPVDRSTPDQPQE